MNRTDRHGLAPLELVLALPMLMMVMALMIIFGNAAYWKVRGLSVARNAAWSNRWPRDGDDEPAPRPWAPGHFSQREAPDVVVLDDPSLQHAVVRGPMPNGFHVNADLLDPKRGAIEGHTRGTFEPAMVPSLDAFTFNLEHPLIDDKFQYLQMSIPANTFRRIPFIYQLPQTDASYSQAWASAAMAVINAPFKPQLAPLDRDEEIRGYYGNYHDFHPRLSRFCSLDHSSAWSNQTRRLIWRIKGHRRPRTAGVPETMASFWIAMYQSQMTRQNSATLQPLIDTLQEFRTRMRNSMDTPDVPVPPLASSTAAARPDFVDAPSLAPLSPIPAVLLDQVADGTRCCGTLLPINDLLRLLDESPDRVEGSP